MGKDRRRQAAQVHAIVATTGGGRTLSAMTSMGDLSHFLSTVFFIICRARTGAGTGPHRSMSVKIVGNKEAIPQTKEAGK